MSLERDELVFRRARREDVAAIVGMLADDALGRQREDYREPLPEAYYAAFAAIDADPRHTLVVAERAGEVVGTLQLTVLPSLSFQGRPRAQVESVRVAAPWRSHGIGGALMQWAIAEARAAGCHVVQLTTDASRADAHRFYARLGFKASHVGMKLPLDPAT